MGFGHFYSDKSTDQQVDKKRSLPSQSLLIPHQTLQVKYKGSRQARGSKVNADISEVRGGNVLWVGEAGNHPGKEMQERERE